MTAPNPQPEQIVVTHEEDQHIDHLTPDLDEEDQLKKWKKLLNSISNNNKKEQQVKKKVDDFIASTNMNRLK